MIVYANILLKTAHAIVGGVNMIDNRELPIGFTMELAQHSDILNQFSHFSKEEQQTIINGAKQMHSRDEMRHYVESIGDKYY